MKKLVLALAMVSILFNACKKDDTTPASTVVTIGAVPEAFNKKVLIEEFTGAWCGYCVDGAYKMETILNSNQGRAIGVAIHDGDGMSTGIFTYLDGIFNSTGYPQGMVSRVPYQGATCLSRSSWSSAANLILNKSVYCGLALKVFTTGDSVKAEVHCGFDTTLTSGSYSLVVYAVENNVTGTGTQFDQHNYYSSASGVSPTPGHPFYNLPEIITGYKHMNVLRKTLTANSGESIPVSSIIKGNELIKNYAFKPTNINTSQLRIVAFIQKNGTSSTTYEVLNVQECAFGSTKNWD